ncbi:exonuclease domain-containing protein [Mesoterricola silvestris]|uniref:DNA polymerase III subunit epsilon n=1 Tax=Mesoterricola silvestris TaxID=2927979 RepID=A0AA48GQC2_9BACT|nr:exonuclease domain-containing protein [Mesoterricola silvestris]BDU72062.1 DNA polymerase III subunit epsilon [Mesoterricola silvestris]
MSFGDLTYLVVDTETTGLNPPADKVVSVAGVWVRAGQGPFRRESFLVDPGIPIPPEASAIHHIVDRHVAGAPALGEVLPVFQKDDFDAYVAHNAAFDFGFLPRAGRPVLCTMRLARKVWPKLSKYSNQYLRYFLQLEVTEAEGLPAHEALADALVTSRLLLKELAWLQENPQPGVETIQDLIAWAEAPNLLETCQFGSKHRGVPWARVPKDYLAWMKREVKDMDPDLRHTVEHYLQ